MREEEKKFKQVTSGDYFLWSQFLIIEPNHFIAHSPNFTFIIKRAFTVSYFNLNEHINFK